MSKAFTSEENEDEDFSEPAALPPGFKNYMTPTGEKRLRAEAEQLEKERRAPSGGEMERQNRQRTIERRLRYLTSRLEAAEIIDPLTQPKDHVRFGATVTVSRVQGPAETWRIVGLDEVDLEKGWISWMSPLASALIEKHAGETISFMNQSLTILRIEYHA